MSKGVTEEAERIFRRPKFKDVEVKTGPGLRLISPERIRSMEKRKLV